MIGSIIRVSFFLDLGIFASGMGLAASSFRTTRSKASFSTFTVFIGTRKFVLRDQIPSCMVRHDSDELETA